MATTKKCDVCGRHEEQAPLTNGIVEIEPYNGSIKDKPFSAVIELEVHWPEDVIDVCEVCGMAAIAAAAKDFFLRTRKKRKPRTKETTK